MFENLRLLLDFEKASGLNHQNHARKVHTHLFWPSPLYLFCEGAKVNTKPKNFESPIKKKKSLKLHVDYAPVNRESSTTGAECSDGGGGGVRGRLSKLPTAARRGRQRAGIGVACRGGSRRPLGGITFRWRDPWCWSSGPDSPSNDSGHESVQSRENKSVKD